MTESTDPVRAALSVPVQIDRLMRLDGSVAVVTGTSSGLGQRFARVLAAAGASAILASRRHVADVELAASLPDALAIPCDVRSPAERQTLVSSALERFGRIDILVNNAGIAHSEPAETEPVDQVRQLLETNLVSLYALTQLVAQHMLIRRAGVIVNIASPSATVSLDRYPLAGYGASKAGVVALTHELAAQWGTRGIRSTPSPRRSSPAPPPDGSKILTKSHGSHPTSPRPRGTCRRTRRPTPLPRQRRIQLHHWPNTSRRWRLVLT